MDQNDKLEILQAIEKLSKKIDEQTEQILEIKEKEIPSMKNEIVKMNEAIIEIREKEIPSMKNEISRLNTREFDTFES